MNSKYKIIFLDADGVLFKGKEFWIDLHKAFGTLEQGKILTEKYLNTDYNKLEHEVVYKLWKGMDARPYYELVKNREYMKGVRELFEFIKRKGWVSVIISGGSLDLIKRAQKDFGVDYLFANELIIKSDRVAGYRGTVKAGFKKKSDIIEQLCKKIGIDTKEAIFIGDSNYDIDAFGAVGKAIAFNSDSEKLKKKANLIIDSDDLNDVVKHLKSE